jgi:hypothetical protein
MNNYKLIATLLFKRQMELDKSRAPTPNVYQAFERPLAVSIYSDLIPSVQTTIASQIDTMSSINSFAISTNSITTEVTKKKSNSKHSLSSIKTIKLIKKKNLEKKSTEAAAKEQSKNLKVASITIDPSKLKKESEHRIYQSINEKFVKNIFNSDSQASFSNGQSLKDSSSFFGKLKAKKEEKKEKEREKQEQPGTKNSHKKAAKKINPQNENTNKPTKPYHRIREFKYVILTELKVGEGEFSETFQAYRYDLGPPIRIAAKKLKSCNQDNEDQKTVELLSEIAALCELGKHENVIDFLGVHLFSNTMYLIFEYADRGDLKRILDAQRKGKRDIFLNKLKVCYEIASGMEYVSSLNIVHKDLATRNILLDKSYTSKIADFGCCKLEFMAKRPCKKFRNF